MRTVRWSFVLAVLIAACATEASAMQLEPQTLLMMTSESELIVSANVEKITLIWRNKHCFRRLNNLVIFRMNKT
jgi:uncharacterized protein YcfL